MKNTTMSNFRHLLFLVMVCHFLLIFLAGLFRHWGYLTSINDLGVFDQAVWGFLNGEPFLNTILFQEKINWLAVHFHPVLLIFSPFYLIYSSPFWLTLSQALALTLAAWPIYLLANRIFNSDRTAFLWAIVYLVNPFVLNAAAWDFHPISLAVPFTALGMLAVESKNFKLLCMSVLVILCCKEHLGIMVIGFGLLWWIKNRQWLPGLMLIFIGFVHFYVVLNFIMPAFSHNGQHVMVGEGLGQLSRYAWLGQSVDEIISYVVFNPFHVLKIILLDMGGVFYLVLLLVPFLGFSLAGLFFLLPAAADLAVNMLSANPMPRSPIAYHSVTLIPIFTVAAIYGTKRVGNLIQKFSANEISILILLASFLTGYLLAPFPFPGAKNIWAPNSFVTKPDPKLAEIRSLVGKESSISAQANVGAHFSQRKEIYRFPDKVGHVDVVVLWLDTPTKNVHNYSKDKKENRQFMIGMLDSHFQMDRDDYLNTVINLLEDEDFGLSYWNDPWLVLKRGADHQKDISIIKKKVEEFQNFLSKKPIENDSIYMPYDQKMSITCE